MYESLRKSHLLRQLVILASPTGADEIINWKTFKANGVNLGSWLEKEKNHGEFMLFTFEHSRHVLMTTSRHILVEQYQRRPFDHGRMELVCLT